MRRGMSARTRGWFFIGLAVALLALLWLIGRPKSKPLGKAPGGRKPAPIAGFTLFRGNPERNLSASGPVPRRPKLLWRFLTKTKVEGEYEQRGSNTVTPATIWRGLGWTGQPVVLRDRLYFGSSDSYVYCLQAKTGKVLWYYPNHHCVKGSISIFGDRIYHGGRDNKLHCYDLQGKMVWETRIGNDMDSNPVVADGKLFVGGEDNAIYCFSPKTGKMLWRTPTDGSTESSPCVARGRVVAGSGHGDLYCCEANTGKLLWDFKTLGDTDSTPVYWKGKIYVGCATGDFGEKGHLWCIDLITGKELWHGAMPRGLWATSAINPKKDRLYIGGNDGILYAFSMRDGQLIWKRRLGNRIWSSAAVSDGCILVGARDGLFWCLEEDTGKPIWALDDGFDIDATPLVYNGLIVIGSQNGWVYAIGEAGVREPVNPHWFATEFPMKSRLDHNPAGITTIKNPAPPPRLIRTPAAGTGKIFSSRYTGNCRAALPVRPLSVFSPQKSSPGCRLAGGFYRDCHKALPR
jgi:eukaryotic-like serine/threonine-protein kinase